MNDRPALDHLAIVQAVLETKTTEFVPTEQQAYVLNKISQWTATVANAAWDLRRDANRLTEALENGQYLPEPSHQTPMDIARGIAAQRMSIETACMLLVPMSVVQAFATYAGFGAPHAMAGKAILIEEEG